MGSKIWPRVRKGSTGASKSSPDRTKAPASFSISHRSLHMPRPEGKPIRLLLVDDHEVLRIGLRTLFGETGEFDVVGEAGTMAGAVAEALKTQAGRGADGRAAPGREWHRGLPDNSDDTTRDGRPVSHLLCRRPCGARHDSCGGGRVPVERGQWRTARQRGENRRRRTVDPGPGRGPAGADPCAGDDGRSRRREE